MKKSTTKAGSVAAVVITALGSWSLAACGGGGLDANGQALADSLATDMKDNGEGIFDQSESQCFGDEVVKKIGVERLNELGVTVDNPDGLESVGSAGLTSDEANKMYDALDGCIDLKATLAEAFSVTAGPEAAKCLADKLPDDVIRSLMLAEIVDESADPEQEQKMAEVAQECGLGG